MKEKCNYSGELIENYILHQLSSEQENDFEEHLLFCINCQRELECIKKTIMLVRHEIPENNLSSLREQKGRTISYKFILKIAALIAILMSFTYIISLLLNNKSNSDYSLTQVDSIKKNQYDTLKNIEIQIQKNDILTQSYNKMPEFEKFIKNSLRSENLIIIKPQNGQRLKIKQNIVIEWESNTYDTLNLVIFNNKAKVLLEKRNCRKYILENQLRQGLYYWQLETNEESLFTGKFLIQNTK